ncbi:hypothetical protein H3C65_03815 [Patescibacteria group bacterium]|nr:hypothetical protein [Patescibacteria group bacterium]
MKLIRFFSISLLILINLNCLGHSQVLDSILMPTMLVSDFTTEAYTFQDGFCSKNLFLHGDGTFTFELGCEYSSNATVGRYSTEGEKLILTPFQKEEVHPFYKVEAYGSSATDSQVSVVYRDREGKNLLKLIKFKGKNADYLNGKTSEDWQNQIITFNKSDIDSIYFPKLEELTGQHFTIESKNLPSLLILTSNLGYELFLYPHVKFFHDWEPGIWKLGDGFVEDEQKNLFIKRG